MNNADRFIKIIYREVFQEYLKKYNNYDVNNMVLTNKDFMIEICKQYLNVYPNNYSFDEVKVLYDNQIEILKKHFRVTEINSLHFFVYYADKLLLMNDCKLLVRFDELFEWDGFITKIDSLVLQAAYLSLKNNDNIEQCSTVVRHTENRLYSLLDKGVYDNHMHLNGSGYTWEMNWQKLICCRPLTWKRMNSDNKKLIKYANNQLLIYKIQFLRLYLIRLITKTQLTKKNDINHFKDLINAKSTFDFIAREETLNELYTKGENYFKKYKGSMQEMILTERHLLTEVFKLFLANKLSKYDIFVFNLYISALSYFKFCFIQDNTGMGFDRFKESEAIKSILLENDETTILKSVLDKYYEEGSVRGIEARIAPKKCKDLNDTINKIERLNNEIFNHYYKKNKKTKKIKIGIVIHYIKLEDKPIEYMCRHSSLRSQIKKQSNEINNFFNNIYAKQNFVKEERDISIVGIDAANVEIYCPPEVFAPVFRKHRKFISPYHNFGFTFHVGEDFLNIISGLRAIDETIEFMNFTSGDRLGHAIALGIEIDEYHTYKREYLVTTLQQHVDDLAWAHFIIEEHMFDDTELRYKIQVKFEKYICQLFGEVEYDVPSIYDYQQSMILRADEPEAYQYLELCKKHDFKYDDIYGTDLNLENKYHKQAILLKKARELNHFYHYSTKIKENGKKPLNIEFDETYLLIAKTVQRIVREKIYNKRIVIETNPSSNKKIGPFNMYIELPLYSFNQHRLTPPKNVKKVYNQRNIQVTINTDDSAIFQTNLCNEYSCVALSMIKEGYDYEEVMDYIDYIREMSALTTFLKKT